MPAMIARRGMSAATASSMISAMKTLQCCPSETPLFASCASSPSCTTLSMPENLRPCSSMKEPVPALQASFIAASITRPPESLMYLASWPPISNIVSTSGSKWSAPSAWAAISLSTKTTLAP